LKNILLLLLTCSLIASQGNQEKLKKANDHYSVENYSVAIEIYEDILKSAEHENIYYNLGNSYFRIGEIGNSIWAYEKALKLSPRDSDINFNLKYVRSMVRDRILPPDEIYLIALYNSLILKFNFSDLFLLIGFIILFLSIKHVINNFSLLLKPVNGFINYLTAALLLSFCWMALDKYWDISDKSHGVITESAVDVRSSPLDRGENVLFRIHEGAKVEIYNTQSGWSEIMLVDGKKGWIFSKDVRII